MSFIYKYKLVCGFIKGVSGGCFVLLNKWCYPQSPFTHNLGLTNKLRNDFKNSPKWQTFSESCSFGLHVQANFYFFTKLFMRIELKVTTKQLGGNIVRLLKYLQRMVHWVMCLFFKKAIPGLFYLFLSLQYSFF